MARFVPLYDCVEREAHRLGIDRVELWRRAAQDIPVGRLKVRDVLKRDESKTGAKGYRLSHWLGVACDEIRRGRDPSAVLLRRVLQVTKVLAVEVERWAEAVKRENSHKPRKSHESLHHAELEKAVAELRTGGHEPPKTVSWNKFCDDVRDSCSAWRDRRRGEPAFGFSNKSIQRVFKRIRDRSA